MTLSDSSKERPLRVIAFAPYLDGACGYIRLIGPHKAAGIELVQGFFENPNELINYDVVIIQRDMASARGLIDRVRSTAKACNKPVVYEFDDLLFGLPKEHHQSREYKVLTPPIVTSILEADYVICSTEPLARATRQFNGNVHVVPNYLDDTLWPIKEIKPAKKGSVTLGYMGTWSHVTDVKLMSKALIRAAAVFPEELKMVFYLPELPDELKGLVNVKHIPLQIRNYRDFVDYFSKQEFDFGIAPLSVNWFNRCKSGIKYFEYAAMGVPGIYADLEPYRDVVQAGVTGLFADSEDDWFNAISRLVTDSEYRHSLAQSAQADLKENWLLSKNANQLNDLYRSFIANYSPVRNVRADLYPIAKYFEEAYEEFRIDALTTTEYRKMLITIFNSKLWTIVSKMAYFGNRLRLFGKGIVEVSKHREEVLKESIDRDLSAELLSEVFAEGRDEALGHAVENKQIQRDIIPQETSIAPIA